MNTKRDRLKPLIKRAQCTKLVLEYGDIVSIQVPTVSRGACDHPWLPEMVTKIILKSKQETQYEVCSKHGVLAGVFPRNQLYHNKYLTAELLGINEAHARERRSLSVAFCKCKSNCSKNSRCSCVMLGKFCLKKCHMKRIDGTKAKCRNFAPTKHN